MKRFIVYGAGLALAGAAFAQTYDTIVAPQAQGDYPACSATITDRCIQLYEPGVATPANLALNDRLGDGTMMAEADMVDDDVYADAGYAEPGYVESEYAYAEPVADEYAYSGYDNSAMGGPYEPVWSREYVSGNWPAATTGEYDACDPHPADDRCIQLYERGVGYY